MIKVFNLGLSRCGTTTTHRILERLGLRSVHFCRDLIGQPDWSVLERYDAFGDLPVPTLFEEIDQRCPGARFLLTIRDVDQWLESMHWHLETGWASGRWSEIAHGVNRACYGTDVFDREQLAAAWDIHHEKVARHFANRAQDLLTIDIDAGFDVPRICRFIGVPVQNFPVARANARPRRGLSSLWKKFT